VTGSRQRSIPEKTLEHWTSIYLSNRFPNGALWWPAAGEDVLAELPRLAASGPGKTLALELKTTQARGTNHVLEIDTHQLNRYLNPPSGPPLPVYYVFPAPHWTGPLTSRSGFAPATPTGTTATPPAWWRRRVGPAWFADWLYVLSARSLAAALPPAWQHRRSARLFTLNNTHLVGRTPDWASAFSQPLTRRPVAWKRFWKVVTRCGPDDGVRWRTLAGDNGLPDQVLVLDDDGQRQQWPIGALLDQSGLEWEQVSPTDSDIAGFDKVTGGDEGEDIGGNERLLLHIPDSALT
jgi:hypothetical protein